MTRWIGLALAVVLGCGRNAAETGPAAEAPPVPGVETAAAVRAPVRDLVEAFATVAPAGEAPEERDARATLAEAEARRTLAAQQVQRAEALVPGSIAPRRDLETARAELAAAEAAVARARQAVAAFGAHAGDAAAATDETDVIARVLQLDMLRVARDAGGTLTADALPGVAFVVRVASAPAYVDPATHLAPVPLRVRDPERALRPGMTGAARLEVGAPRDAVVVPVAAVVYDEVQPVVFVEEAPGRFAARPVRLGVARDGRVEVVSGVEAGARVATTGAASLLSATRLPAGAD